MTNMNYCSGGHDVALDRIIEHVGTIANSGRTRRTLRAAVNDILDATAAAITVARCAAAAEEHARGERDSMIRTVGALERGLSHSERDLATARSETRALKEVTREATRNGIAVDRALRGAQRDLTDLRALRNIDLAAIREHAERADEEHNRLALAIGELEVAREERQHAEQRADLLEDVLRTYEARLNGEYRARESIESNLRDALASITRLETDLANARTEQLEDADREQWLEGLIESARSGNTVEIRGVKIQRCDTYGRTETDIRLENLIAGRVSDPISDAQRERGFAYRDGQAVGGPTITGKSAGPFVEPMGPGMTHPPRTATHKPKGARRG